MAGAAKARATVQPRLPGRTLRPRRGAFPPLPGSLLPRRAGEAGGSRRALPFPVRLLSVVYLLAQVQEAEQAGEQGLAALPGAQPAPQAAERRQEALAGQRQQAGEQGAQQRGGQRRGGHAAPRACGRTGSSLCSAPHEVPCWVGGSPGTLHASELPTRTGRGSPSAVLGGSAPLCEQGAAWVRTTGRNRSPPHLFPWSLLPSLGSFPLWDTLLSPFSLRSLYCSVPPTWSFHQSKWQEQLQSKGQQQQKNQLPI